MRHHVPRGTNDFKFASVQSNSLFIRLSVCLSVEGIYLTIIMFLTSVSVIMTVLVLNLHYRGPSDTPIPTWLRRLLIRSKNQHHGHSLTAKNLYVDEYLVEEGQPLVHHIPLGLTLEGLAAGLAEELIQHDDSPEMDSASSGRGREVFGVNDRWTQLKECRIAYSGGCSRDSELLASANKSILEGLKAVLERYEREEASGAIVFEWRQVAIRVDRILFWIFLVCTLASTIVLLVIIPLMKQWRNYRHHT